MKTMKSEWGASRLEVQVFAPNEFVAACYNPEIWTAQCCNQADKGWIFFDYNKNGVIDDAERVTEGNHGGCEQKHEFKITDEGGIPSSYNAWVLKANIAEYNMFEGGHHHIEEGYILKKEYVDKLIPALVKRPGEALGHNWLVCYDLASVHHPS